MTSRPTSDLKRPRSSSVLAITGSAEMLSATPRKSATSRAPRRDRPGPTSGSRNPSATPLANGSTMPSRPVSAAVRPAPAQHAEVHLDADDHEEQDHGDRRVAADHRLRGARREQPRLRRAARCARGPSARARCPPRSRPTTIGIPSSRASSPSRRAEASITPSERRKTRLSCSVMRVHPRASGPFVVVLALRVGPGRRCLVRGAQRLLRRRGVRARQGPGHAASLAGAKRRPEGDRRRVDRRPAGPLPLRHAVRHHAGEPGPRLDWRARDGRRPRPGRPVADGSARRAGAGTSQSTCPRSPSSRSAMSSSASSCPKLVAIQRSEGTALAAAIPLRVIYFTFFPVLWLLERSSGLILRAVGLSPDVASVEGRFSQDEILAILAASAARSPRGRVARGAPRARHALLAARGAPLDGAARRRRVSARSRRPAQGRRRVRALSPVLASRPDERPLARRRRGVPLRQGLPAAPRRRRASPICARCGATSSSSPRCRAASTCCARCSASRSPSLSSSTSTEARAGS